MAGDADDGVRVVGNNAGGTDRMAGAGPVTEMLDIGGTATIEASTGIDFAQTLLDPTLNAVFGDEVTLDTDAGNAVVDADSALTLAGVNVAAGDSDADDQ